jgi:hypothetical protein
MGKSVLSLQYLGHRGQSHGDFRSKCSQRSFTVRPRSQVLRQVKCEVQRPCVISLWTRPDIGAAPFFELVDSRPPPFIAVGFLVFKGITKK